MQLLLLFVLLLLCLDSDDDFDRLSFEFRFVSFFRTGAADNEEDEADFVFKFEVDDVDILSFAK